jgi:probable biosynthetic protein (TIGR04099 family)
VSAVHSLTPVGDARRRTLAEQALQPDILLGMPHLTPFGLSETWLLKELAHRHWLLLGRLLDLPDADFRGPDGRPAYAAICASALRRADLGKAAANDVLTIRSSIAPISRTRMGSMHQLFANGLPIGEIELISTFVERQYARSNRSVVRVAMQNFGAVQPQTVSLLAEAAKLIRRGAINEYCGFTLTDSAPLKSYQFSPVIMQDFNGAGLFYFANFQAATDRTFAEWSVPGCVQTIVRREIFYVGNVEIGEPITIELHSVSADGSRAHTIMMRPDGALISHQFSWFAVAALSATYAGRPSEQI